MYITFVNIKLKFRKSIRVIKKNGNNIAVAAC